MVSKCACRPALRLTGGPRPVGSHRSGSTHAKAQPVKTPQSITLPCAQSHHALQCTVLHFYPPHSHSGRPRGCTEASLALRSCLTSSHAQRPTTYSSYTASERACAGSAGSQRTVLPAIRSVSISLQAVKPFLRRLFSLNTCTSI